MTFANMVVYKNSRLILSSFIILMLFSCTKAPEPTITPATTKAVIKSELLENIRKANPKKCDIKSKVIFSYEDRVSAGKSKGYIQKSCDNSGELALLGPFSQVMLSVSFYNKRLLFVKGEENLTPALKGMINEKDIFDYLNKLNFPYKIPEDNYLLYIKDGLYHFSDRDTSIIVDSNYKIIKYSSPVVVILYKYNNDILEDIEIEELDFYRKIKITFIS